MTVDNVTAIITIMPSMAVATVAVVAVHLSCLSALVHSQGTQSDADSEAGEANGAKRQNEGAKASSFQRCSASSEEKGFRWFRDVEGFPGGGTRLSWTVRSNTE